MKNLGDHTKTSEMILTNRLQDIGEREFQVLKTRLKKWINWSKKMLNQNLIKMLNVREFGGCSNDQQA